MAGESIAREGDEIGPLGPFPPAPGTVVEVGRLPIVIEGKWVTEYEPDGSTPHRVYNYSKAATGDNLDG